MSDFAIRSATEADTSVLLTLIRELADYENLSAKVVVTEEVLRRWLFGERRVAEAVLGLWKGEPAAYAVFYPTYATFSGEAGLYLEDIFVRPDYRGRGCGAALLRHLARLSRQRGFSRMSWAVLDWNQPAIGFYRHLGARPAPQEWLAYLLEDAPLTRLANDDTR